MYIRSLPLNSRPRRGQSRGHLDHDLQVLLGCCHIQDVLNIPSKCVPLSLSLFTFPFFTVCVYCFPLSLSLLTPSMVFYGEKAADRERGEREERERREREREEREGEIRQLKIKYRRLAAISSQLYYRPDSRTSSGLVRSLFLVVCEIRA